LLTEGVYTLLYLISWIYICINMSFRLFCLISCKLLSLILRSFGQMIWSTHGELCLHSSSITWKKVSVELV